MPRRSSYPFRPNWTIHPGETVKELLEELGLSVRIAAVALNVPAEELGMVCRCKAPITEELSRRLSRLGVSETFWRNLQRDHDQLLAEGALNLSEGRAETDR